MHTVLGRIRPQGKSKNDLHGNQGIRQNPLRNPNERIDCNRSKAGSRKERLHSSGLCKCREKRRTCFVFSARNEHDADGRTFDATIHGRITGEAEARRSGLEKTKRSGRRKNHAAGNVRELPDIRGSQRYQHHQGVNKKA